MEKCVNPIYAHGAYWAVATGFTVLMVVFRSKGRRQHPLLGLYLVHTGVDFAVKDSATAGSVRQYAAMLKTSIWNTGSTKRMKPLIKRKATAEIAWNIAERKLCE